MFSSGPGSSVHPLACHAFLWSAEDLRVGTQTQSEPVGEGIGLEWLLRKQMLLEATENIPDNVDLHKGRK